MAKSKTGKLTKEDREVAQKLKATADQLKKSKATHETKRRSSERGHRAAPGDRAGHRHPGSGQMARRGLAPQSDAVPAGPGTADAPLRNKMAVGQIRTAAEAAKAMQRGSLDI
jgi:hypothetical protein